MPGERSLIPRAPALPAAPVGLEGSVPVACAATSTSKAAPVAIEAPRSSREAVVQAAVFAAFHASPRELGASIATGAALLVLVAAQAASRRPSPEPHGRCGERERARG